MPFKSQAQRRKFAELLVEAKISPDLQGGRGAKKALMPDRRRIR